MKRGEIWWANLGAPIGSRPGLRRPVIIIQANEFNKSLINTVIVIILTSNLRLAQSPGNVLLPMKITNLSKDSVANVSQLISIDKTSLTEYISIVPARSLETINAGLKIILGLN